MNVKWKVLAMAALLTAGSATTLPAHAQQFSAGGNVANAELLALKQRLEALERMMATYETILKKITAANCSGQNNFITGFNQDGTAVCDRVRF